MFAETEAQRAQAMRQFPARLGTARTPGGSRLIEALALIEARIDFSDDDVPDDLVSPALHAARELVEEIEKTLSDEHRGERLREGLTVAIAGPPNAGKSSLLNRLARREAAIVSPYAGTTRDVIEVHLDLAGYPVTLLDTAGVRESEDPVEQEGVRRARARGGGGGPGAVGGGGGGGGRRSGQMSAASRARNESTKTWIIHNKIDLSPARAQPEIKRDIAISALTGQGLERLVADLPLRPRRLGAANRARHSRAPPCCAAANGGGVERRWRSAAPARRN